MPTVFLFHLRCEACICKVRFILGCLVILEPQTVARDFDVRSGPLRLEWHMFHIIK